MAGASTGFQYQLNLNREPFMVWYINIYVWQLSHFHQFIAIVNLVLLLVLVLPTYLLSLAST